jgi:hypothetical protein
VKPRSASRFIALSIVAAGILTFFWPLVTTDPAVAGTTRWSCLDIVRQMYNGALPTPACERCGEPWVRALLALPYWVTAEYLLLLAALIILCLRMPAVLVALTAIAGVLSCYEGWYWRGFVPWNFEETFFGSSGHGHVHYGGLLVTNLVIMAALLLAALDLRDEEESSEQARPRSQLLVESQEPRIIDAEIVAENENAHETPDDPPRLHD